MQRSHRERVCARSIASVMSDPLTTARQAPLFMGFSRQENWSGLPFPSAGDLPNLGTEPWCPALQADSLLSEPPGMPLTSNDYATHGKLRARVILYLK